MNLSWGVLIVDVASSTASPLAEPEPPKLEWSGYFCTLLPTCALHWQEDVLSQSVA